ncbi:MAG: response regulator transcription factor [Peptococcaceae bacterium]|nr:response regulator transcription factor [Peptococcaceae bacterium]
MVSVFVVEDDDSIREMLVYALNSAGFQVRGFADGFDFEAALLQEAPDLVLLDIMLPGKDGMELLSRLRKSPPHSRLPVIILSAKSGEMDRIKGLDLGADDYVGKPFSVLEVISRVRAVLRRSGNQTDLPDELRVGPVVLNEEKRSVLVDGREVVLTYKEFELLHYLMINEGIVLSRDKLLAQVWGFDYNGESRTVDMHIKSLRQKLGDGGAVIGTVRNVGYKIGN